MSNTNTGWLFYKKYYHNLNLEGDNNNFEQVTNQIINTSLAETKVEITDAFNFELKTTYPGLLIGSGYQHETGGKNEFKIGFHFDYTTGLPVIPGSSIKGTLRSVFPFHRKDLGDDFKLPRIIYLIDMIKTIIGFDEKIDDEITEIQIKELELEIFDGKEFIIENSEKKVRNLPLNSRDIFYDSFPSKSNNVNNKLFAADFITHHESPIKNPNPVMFLKVLPDVEFKLFVKTENSKAIKKLTAEKKVELFKIIILNLGLGAKTNVGYGQFEFVKPPVILLDENITKEHKKILQIKPNQEENKYEAIVKQINEHDYLFELTEVADCRLRKTKETVLKKFEIDLKRHNIKLPNRTCKKLEEGDKLTLWFKIVTEKELVYTVLPIWQD